MLCLKDRSVPDLDLLVLNMTNTIPQNTYIPGILTVGTQGEYAVVTTTRHRKLTQTGIQTGTELDNGSKAQSRQHSRQPLQMASQHVVVMVNRGLIQNRQHIGQLWWEGLGMEANVLYGSSDLHPVGQPVAFRVCALHSEEDIPSRNHTALRHRLDLNWEVTVILLKWHINTGSHNAECQRCSLHTSGQNINKLQDMGISLSHMFN